jgi:hypothetical protein
MFKAPNGRLYPRKVSYYLQPPSHERYTSGMKLTKIVLTLALAWCCSSAFAQWQWIDKDGRKVFSDRAPPPEILDKNITKRPAGRTQKRAGPEPEAGQPAAAASPALPTAASKEIGVDKELEARKKQALEAAAAKRKAEEERVAKAMIESCARAKQAKATYGSGVRIASTNAAGEKVILDDASRAAEMKRLQGIMDSDCK